ncbi:flagellar basal body P-ring protein FlgI [Gimesia algae]|uniref:Flagellar basal body P-ring protein n=1 Tax=Gimesia algae TaxID=2527971 RepID=A0A517VBW7_9PLAN|nr:flagellar basal body P-ring protein FlgI [Gimesia algae]QDT90479.1 flagellar basal body P-ring protein [Gimesia algae]
MRYLKFSILSGIALFAVAMFFLSRSINGFLEVSNESEQVATDSALELSLSEPGEFPELNLDFPAGSNESPEKPESVLESQTSQTDNKPSTQKTPGQVSGQPKVRLLTTVPNQTGTVPELNILLLSQTTREQRTTLIEELIRLDADLVRHVAIAAGLQQDQSSGVRRKVQQIALSGSAPGQTISAGYSPRQHPTLGGSFLVHQQQTTQIVATYRGISIKFSGTPLQNGQLHQTVKVVPANTNTLMPATVISQNLVAIDLPAQLSQAVSNQSVPAVKLSEVGEFQPAEIVKLTGAGLVIGLNGTGDRNISAEAIRALKSSLNAMNIDQRSIKTPIQSGNLANVSIVVYIPNQGVSRGKQLECYVSAATPGVDLTGGYLLPTTMIISGSKNSKADAMAMGSVQTDQSKQKSQAMIARGAQLLTDVNPRLVSGQGIPHLKFFLNADSHTPQLSTLITRQINQFLQSEKQLNSKAMLQSSSLIMISLPHNDPQQAHHLATQLLSLSLPLQSGTPEAEPPQVIIESRTGKLQTRGNVLLQSAFVNQQDLILEVGTSTQNGTTNGADLLALMQHLQIPQQTQIQLLLQLQQQGKINAPLLRQ